uniref:Uncharacterized protein n=2 Tax=Cacopsylla melanoneura TaxID=428564 RepID=A0A8D8QS35_9HEMI
MIILYSNINMQDFLSYLKYQYHHTGIHYTNRQSWERTYTDKFLPPFFRHFLAPKGFSSQVLIKDKNYLSKHQTVPERRSISLSGGVAFFPVQQASVPSTYSVGQKLTE